MKEDSRADAEAKAQERRQKEAEGDDNDEAPPEAAAAKPSVSTPDVQYGKLQVLSEHDESPLELGDVCAGALPTLFDSIICPKRGPSICLYLPFSSV